MEKTAARAAAAPATAVEVDALVLIKIMKHCRENFPACVNGQLLGLDSAERLEITDCICLQNKNNLWAQFAKDKHDPKDVDEKVTEAQTQYETKMMEMMRLVQSDCLTVGWYQTMTFEDLRDLEVLDSLCEYQLTTPSAVVIGFDPVLPTGGKLPFRAYRATQEYLRSHRSGQKADQEALNKLKGHNVLEEVHLSVRNSLLVEAFLLEWLGSDSRLLAATESDALEVDQLGYTKKSLQFVCGCLDDLTLEQDKLMRYQKDHFRQQTQLKQFQERRRLENDARKMRGESELSMTHEAPHIKKLEAPSHIATFLMSNQVDHISDDISNIASNNLAKTFMLSRPFAQRS